jgi:hypothetical protein
MYFTFIDLSRYLVINVIVIELVNYPFITMAIIEAMIVFYILYMVIN